jgi:hypothetical protein
MTERGLLQLRWLLGGVVIAVLTTACGAQTPATHGPASSTSGLSTAAPTVESTVSSAPLPSYPTALPTLAPPRIDTSSAPSRLHLARSNGTSAWIGSLGGTLSATGEDGTTYTLVVPAGAVLDPTAITMTPINSIDHLGFSGGLAAAVFLQPAGETLAVPATLTVSSRATAPTGGEPIGFDVADDGTTVDLIPAASVDGGTVVLVSHFSAPGIAFGTTDDLAQFRTGTGTDIQELLTRQLAIAKPWGGTAGAESALLIGGAWNGVIRSDLTNATTDAALLQAISDWRTGILMLNLDWREGDLRLALADGERYRGDNLLYRDLVLAGAHELGVAMLNAVDGNRDTCNASHDLHALANQAFWADLGARFAADAADWSQAKLGCAVPVISLFNPPTNLRAGTADSLQLALEVKFSDGTQVAADLQLALHATGFVWGSTGTADMQIGETASEQLRVGGSAVASPPYTLQVTGCLVLDGLLRSVCGDDTREFGPAASSPPQPSGPAGDAPDWNAPCVQLLYQGTITDFTTPSHPQHAGQAQVLTACNGAPAVISGIVADGFDVTQGRIVFKIQGGPTGFTATELSCSMGLPNNGCTGNTTISGGGSVTLTFTITATKTGEQLYTFTGNLTQTVKAR